MGLEVGSLELTAQQRNGLGKLNNEWRLAAPVPGHRGEELALSACDHAQCRPAEWDRGTWGHLPQGLRVLSGLPEQRSTVGGHPGKSLLALTGDPSPWPPGGLTAVIYTDALQTVVMVGGALVLTFLGKEET